MVSKRICESCDAHDYGYTIEERDGLIIACGVKYLRLIQSLEQARNRRLVDEELLAVWELMIDLGLEKIA